jgi:uncharacterized protein YidB (DUF937 family)
MIDYEALAKKYGGTTAPPATDYATMAKKYGGSVRDPGSAAVESARAALAMTKEQHNDRLAQLLRERETGQMKGSSTLAELPGALTSGETWGKMGEAAMNVPGSAWGFAKGLASSFNPLQVKETASQIPSGFSELAKTEGGYGKATVAVAKEVPKAAYETLVPEAWRALLSGDSKKAEEVLIKDSFGQAAIPVLAALGAGELYKKGVESIPLDAESSVPRTVKNPVTGVLEAIARPVTGTAEAGLKGIGAGVKGTAKFATAQMSGLKPETIQTAIEGAGKVSKAIKAGVNRETVARKVSEALDTEIEAMSDTGKGYQEFRKAPTTSIRVPANLFHSVLNEFGITMKDGKVVLSEESPHLSAGDKAALEGVFDQYGKSGVMSSNAYLNFRQALDGMAKWDSAKTGNLEAITRAVRSKFNDFAHKQNPDLAKLDAEYGPMAEQMKQFKKDWLQKDAQGNFTLKDGAVNKIANATGVGKKALLARLEEIVPGITEELHVIKAIEDIEVAHGQKVGAYTRSLLAGGGGYAMGGPVGGLAGMVLTNPSVVLKVLEAVGKVQGLSKSAMTKLRAAAEQGMDKVLEEVNKEVKPGLTTEDVSKGELPKAPSTASVEGGMPSSRTSTEPHR